MTADSTGLNTFSQVVDIVKAIVTIIAIFVGGWWSHMLFIKTRQKYPRANIRHELEYWLIENEKIFVRIRLKISNVGDVLLSLVSGKTTLQQVMPVVNPVLKSIRAGRDPIEKGKKEIQWPMIEDRELIGKDEQIEIEPNEDDEILCDFLIDKDIQTIQVYSYLKNAEKPGRDIGWGITTIHDLKSKGGPHE